MKISYLLIPIALGALVSACTTEHKEIIDYAYVTTDSVPVQSLNQNAQAQLAEAATSVGQSLQEVSAVEMASNPQPRLAPPMNPESIGMAQQSSLNWTGPIEPLLKKIALVSHYQLRVLGEPPAIPVIVSINAKNVPLADILRDATYQMNKKADVFVYPSSKTIELRYHAS